MPRNYFMQLGPGTLQYDGTNSAEVLVEVHGAAADLESGPGRIEIAEETATTLTFNVYTISNHLLSSPVINRYDWIGLCSAGAINTIPDSELHGSDTFWFFGDPGASE